MEAPFSGTPDESTESPGNSSHDGTGYTTSATSPSSSKGIPSSQRLRVGTHTQLSKEALDFRSDLANYLALGCLCFEDMTIVDDEAEPAGWQEVVDLPVLPRFEASLYAHLAKLAEAGWIRLRVCRSTLNRRFYIWRVYILPGDAGHRFIDRQNKKLWAALESLIADVDVSTETWQGCYAPGSHRKFDLWARSDEGSLFYMFNKLPSPFPSTESVEERYAREALEDLLDPASVLPGLKTVLYPCQRRSAGLMLQRESAAKLELDPRLEPRTAPDGSTFYYGARDLLFLRQPRYYEACRGGILAETMGLGKTVILLSTILATKDHPPKVPAQYSTPATRPSVGSLAGMTVSAINRKSVPWKVEFDRIKHATGNDMTGCIDKLEHAPPCYYVPMEPQRWNRKTILPPPKKITLACTTLIVVPRNLCKQWQSEIKKHVEGEALRVLVMEDLKRALPPPDELRTYDVVLFSRNRFEMEIRDGSDEQGRRILATQLVCRCSYIGATRTRDCRCIRGDDLYDSPLKHLHFKRLIIDEGHFFSNNNSAAVAVANKLVKADHRWVVSGTPAKDLLGVEVDMSTAENMWQTPGTKDCRDAALEQRRSFNYKEDTAGAVKSLGSLASSFLKIRPWCPPDAGERKADWDEYIYRHEDLRKRTYSGFSSCLRRTLEAMVVKTQPEDVEKDIELPPLSHEVVRLEPSFYDKLTANLFTLVLSANAVTSERTDADYLFHKNSAKARYQLISNLRQSAFFWTGFSEADVEASMKNSNGYLAKEGTACTAEDRELLTGLLACANTILSSAGWQSMSRSHELGFFIDAWPAESAELWAFDGAEGPLMTGVSQLLEAQKHVNERAGTADPGEGLAGAGIRSLAPARYGTAKEEDGDKKKANKPLLTKAGIPTSSLDGEPVLRRRSSSSGKGTKLSSVKISQAFRVAKPRSKCSPKKGSALMVKPEDSPSASTQSEVAPGTSAEPSQLSKKRRRSEMETAEHAADSPYLQSRIVGTSSAKLSYLISQILKYYKDEKILVFYDGDNVAYYVAQMLELLHIKHEIYAKSLAAHLKSEYVVRFDQELQDRVLLMDVKQAAFGLNLSSASRIYFVNPVCRPNIEAQAIKRAHRIGQTRKVYVETLVLKGTIEEAMLERARRMTRSEHLDAKVLEDDGGIREIIQSARLLHVSSEETSGYGQMAPLEEAQQLWGRPGWRDTVGAATAAARSSEKRRRPGVALNDVTDPDEDPRLVYEEAEDVGPSVRRRVLAFVDCTNLDAEDTYVEQDSDDEPIADRWRRAPQAPSAAFSAKGKMRGGLDIILPAFPPAERLAPVWSPLSSPRPAEAHLDAQAQKACRPFSFSQILNAAGPAETSDLQRKEELLQEILKRL
ncbi:hypothetical protein LTR85_006454 [Meristemomyces frigidus]|nr:hypothetical protein LTR85_006454 [Meristemomyces frigidus]